MKKGNYNIFNENGDIKYNLDVSDKRKRLYIVVDDLGVHFRAPAFITKEQLEEVYNNKQKWIEQKLKEQNQKQIDNPALGKSDTAKLLGKNYKIQLQYGEYEKPIAQVCKDCIVIFTNNANDDCDCIAKALDCLYFDVAMQYCQKYYEQISQITGIKISKITVKKLKSCWGRCSTKGHISISHLIAMYFEEAIYYLMLHEMAHMKHPNHSKNYWEYVAKFMPDYEKYRKLLLGRE